MGGVVGGLLLLALLALLAFLIMRKKRRKEEAKGVVPVKEEEEVDATTANSDDDDDIEQQTYYPDEVEKSDLPVNPTAPQQQQHADLTNSHPVVAADEGDNAKNLALPAAAAAAAAAVLPPLTSDENGSAAPSAPAEKAPEDEEQSFVTAMGPQPTGETSFKTSVEGQSHEEDEEEVTSATPIKETLQPIEEEEGTAAAVVPLVPPSILAPIAVAKTTKEDEEDDEEALLQALQPLPSDLAPVSTPGPSGDPLLLWIASHLADPDSHFTQLAKTLVPPGRQPGAAWRTSWEATPWSDLELIQCVGSGNFGRVYHAVWHPSQSATAASTEVAAKMLLELDEAEEERQDQRGGLDLHTVVSVMGVTEYDHRSFSMLERTQQEAALLASLQHVNVAKFIGACIFPPCFLTEYCSRGSLLDVIRGAKGNRSAAQELTWPRRLMLLVGAAQGLNYLHRRSQPVVHRDFKSRNVVIDAGWTAKVTDFTLSRIVASTSRRAIVASNPRWAAPEVLQGEGATPASDVFSFGIVMWELLTWQLPWQSLNTPQSILQNVVTGRRPSIPSAPLLASIGPDALPSLALERYLALMQRCWSQSAALRPAMYVVVRELKLLSNSLSSGGSAASSVSAARMPTSPISLPNSSASPPSWK